MKNDVEQGTRDSIAMASNTLVADASIGSSVSGVDGSCGSLADILIERALHEEAIIREMKAAVMAGDKDTVFLLARELTCVTNDQK